MKVNLGNIVRHEQYDINLSRLEYNLNVDLRIYLFINFLDINKNISIRFKMINVIHIHSKHYIVSSAKNNFFF